MHLPRMAAQVAAELMACLISFCHTAIQHQLTGLPLTAAAVPLLLVSRHLVVCVVTAADSTWAASSMG